jgi:diguanylate cyclase
VIDRGIAVTLPRGAISATSAEMALGAATLYAPGAALVYVALLLREPGSSILALATVATLALGTAVGLLLIGARLAEWVFPWLVTLGIVLITTAIFAGGGVGAAFACFYIWSGMYAWYFLSNRDAVIQTCIIVAVCISVGVTGRASALFVLMIVGTLITVCLWLRHAVLGVRSQAVTDGLTDVPNRRGWDQALQAELGRSTRSQRALCAAMLDLDHFKVFNDENGHQTGDLLLQTTVRLWRAGLRETDTIARYGGEEFCVLLPGCPLDRAATLIENLRRLVPRGLTCSAGVAQWDGQETADSLMLRADAALYDAKRQGRNRLVLAPAPGDAASHRVAPTTLWTGVALEALRSGRVGSVYQPVVRLSDRLIAGYEALARPAAMDALAGVEGLFVAAQRMGLTREIDYLCRRSALECARPLPPGVPLFINISVAALLDPEHDPDQMLFLARLAGRRPESIVLEISERERITDPIRLAAAVRAYRECGFRFAVDDVGEGHSTFETLAAATPEYVKLARHFVRGVREAGPRAAVIAARSFAEASDATVIAEGIEDEESVRLLRDLDIELGQGFHLAPPARIEAVVEEDDALPATIAGSA